MKQDAEQARKRRSRRRRRKRRGQRIVLLVILVLVAVAAVLIWKNSQPEAVPPTAEALAPTAELEIDPKAGKMVTPTPAPTEPGVAIPGWGSITLPAGVTEAATALKNSEANEDWYYLTLRCACPPWTRRRARKATRFCLLPA